MHGPCYETRAEIAALRSLGDACVGMSIAPELFRCQELGMPAGVLSCVTNVCGGTDKLTHTAVLSAARQASARLRALLRQALKH
jgi:purine-nucleoside phosphorylase